MNGNKSITVLCVASLQVKAEFIETCKKEGNRVILITSQSLESFDLPKENIDEIFYIPDINGSWDNKDVISAVGYLAKTEKIDKVVPLSECDIIYVDKINEHFQLKPIFDFKFTDLLKLRNYLFDAGLLVPEYIHALNFDEIEDFIKVGSFPLLLKPRFRGLYFKLKKCYNSEELWGYLNRIGDLTSYYLIERFINGVTYHVDSLLYNGKIQHSLVSQYGFSPVQSIPHGRVFTSKTVLKNTVDEQNILQLNKQVLKTINFTTGIVHVEIIKSDITGRYFITSIIPHIADEYLSEMFFAATGINLWKEWAMLIINGKGTSDIIKPQQYAGLIFSDTWQEQPLLDDYDDDEIKHKIVGKNQAAIILASDNYNKITELIKEYTKRFYIDFFANEKINQP